MHSLAARALPRHRRDRRALGLPMIALTAPRSGREGEIQAGGPPPRPYFVRTAAASSARPRASRAPALAAEEGAGDVDGNVGKSELAHR